MMNKVVWVIGAGQMAVDYTRVLAAQKVDFCVVGRGEDSARVFEEKIECTVARGGLDGFLAGHPQLPGAAVVCVSVEQLSHVACQLLDYGVRKILLEKPGGINSKDLDVLAKKATEKGAEVFIAYNRRFYAGVAKAMEIIRDDSGVTSFNFEFTEWSHVIQGLEKGAGVKEHWFLANSTHVVDLAFFLGGKPKRIACFTSGGLDWHPAAAVFAGAGVSESGALFSYQANWAAPGRWSVEVLTRKHRLIFRPMEKLQIQRIGSVAVEEVATDDSLDHQYKPGLYLQVENFLEDRTNGFCTLQEQCEKLPLYEQIAGYSSQGSN